MANPYEFVQKLEEEMGKKTLSEWIKLVRKSDNYKARIIACNILLDIKYENISEKFKEKIIKNLINYLDEFKEDHPEEKDLYEQIKGFLDTENGKSVFCSGNSIRIREKLEFGRIVKWSSILGRLKFQGPHYINDWTPRSRSELNSILHSWNKAGILPDFSSKSPLFWIFKKNEIEECQNRGERCNVDPNCTSELPCNFDIICKQMGKIYHKNTDIIQVDFPRHSIQGDFQTPTVFDSRFNLTFRSIFGEWGKTINVESTIEEADEAIHEEHRWPDEFEATRYGKISEDIEFSTEKEALFSKKLEEEAGEIPNWF